MMTTTSAHRVFLTLLLLGNCVLACRGGCGNDNQGSGAGSTSNADASAADSSADALPYLPSRKVPDDSAEQTSLVDHVLAGLRPQLNLCYRQASENNPKLEAQTILSVTIDQEGRVSEVRPVSYTNVDDAFMGCLRRQVRTVLFPKPPGGPVTVNVPFVFKPRADAGGSDAASVRDAKADR
jgi:hypothetical protein